MVLWLCCVLMGLCVCVFLGPVCYQNLICGILELWSFFFAAADRFPFSVVVCCRLRCPKVAFLFFVVVIVDSWCFMFSPLFGESTVVLVRLCFHSRRKKELESPPT